MHAPVLGVNFRVMHNGNFFMDGTVLKYKKGQVLLLNGVFPKAITKAYIEEKIMRGGGFADIKDIYYLEPGRRLNRGLFRIADDEAIKGMMRFTGWNKTVLIYVVRESEIGPDELRNLSTQQPSPHLSDVQWNPSAEDHVSPSVRTRATNPIKGSRQKLPIRSKGRVLIEPVEKSVIGDENDVERNSEDMVIQTESSSNESEFEMSENDASDVDLVEESTRPQLDEGFNAEEVDDAIDELMEARGKSLIV